MKKMTNYISLEEVEQALNVEEYAKDIKNYLPNMKDYFFEVFNFVACESASHASDYKLFEVVNNNKDAFNHFVENECKNDDVNIHDFAMRFMSDVIYDSLYNNSENVTLYTLLHYLIDAYSNFDHVPQQLANAIELGFIPSFIYTYLLQCSHFAKPCEMKMQDLFDMVQSSLIAYEKETSKA